MTKFFKNLYRLILIRTPFFILLNYISNFLPNYKKKNKSSKIENQIYSDFKSFDFKEKWFCKNLYYLDNYFKYSNDVSDILEIGSYEGRSAIFFLQTFRNSKITCVDTWSGSDEHLKQNFNISETNFDTNTRLYQNDNRLKKIKIPQMIFFLIIFNLLT